MRRILLLTLFALFATIVLMQPLATAADDEQPAALGYQSVLIGLGQVPPVASVGRGLATYLVTQDSGSVYYSLTVLDVSSPISMAHIHLGNAGQNGEVVANLCGAGSTPACPGSGLIASGTITASSLVGPLAGHPLSDLVVAMTAGSTYTNVHTANFPDGEIRGQVVLVAATGEGDQGNGNGNGDENNNNNDNGNHDDQGEDD